MKNFKHIKRYDESNNISNEHYNYLTGGAVYDIFTENFANDHTDEIRNLFGKLYGQLSSVLKFGGYIDDDEYFTPIGKKFVKYDHFDEYFDWFMFDRSDGYIINLLENLPNIKDWKIKDRKVREL